ncbi:MAG: HEAT repeat domain-containing protein, partial [Symploca sp. SIO2E6]|nr:HEAT repeat domain-containing protein [Symploca sp. SIO2E6]
CHDRYIREAAISEIGEMVESNTNLQEIEEAIEPLISAMRNDYMSQVRKEAKQVGESIYHQLETDVELQVSDEKAKQLQLTLDVVSQSASKEKIILDLPAETLLGILGNSNADVEQRIQSARELAGLKNYGAIGEFLKIIANYDIDPNLRATVAESLGKYEEVDESATTGLIKALINDKDSFVRAKAAESLGILIAVSAIDYLNEAARTDVFSSVRDPAQKALENIATHADLVAEDQDKAEEYLKLMKLEFTIDDDHRSISELEAVVKDNQVAKQERRKAALILGKRKDNLPEAKEVLINTLTEEKDPDVCAAIAHSLSQLADTDALQPLLSKLKELEQGDRVAREAIVTALGKLRLEQLEQQEVINVLIARWRNDPISKVREAIEQAIEDIYLGTGYEPALRAVERYSNNPSKVKMLKSERAKRLQDNHQVST